MLWKKINRFVTFFLSAIARSFCNLSIWFRFFKVQIQSESSFNYLYLLLRPCVKWNCCRRLNSQEKNITLELGNVWHLNIHTCWFSLPQIAYWKWYSQNGKESQLNRGDCYWLWRVLTYIGVLQMKSKHIDSWTIKPKTLQQSPNITLQELMLINIELKLIIITNIESLLNINHKPLKSEACNHCLLKESAVK